MMIYVISLGAGLLVGVIYGVLDVRSPAPPVVALVGLLGILMGEQVVPVARRWMSGESVTAAWMKTECTPHVFGELPARASHSRVMENET
jgi:XapX domain-containing protein